MLKHFPKDLLPARDVQKVALKAIEQAFAAGKRAFVLDAPTGAGKSAIGITVSHYFGSAFITSPQNLLVDQVAGDFKSLRRVSGKSTYICRAFPFPASVLGDERTCEDAEDTDKELHDEVCRDYIPARNAFWGGPLSVTNLDFLYWAPCPPSLECTMFHRELLVIDECHNLEEKLIGFGRTPISERQCWRVGLPRQFFHGVGNQQLAERRLQEFIAAVKRTTFKEPKEGRTFRRKVSAIELALAASEWMCWWDKEKSCFVVCPLDAKIQAAKLLGKADRILFMSATVGGVKELLGGLGIPEDEAGYCAVPHSVPAQSRMVSYQPVGFMNTPKTDRERKRYQHTFDQAMSACSQVLDHNAKDKGLILCASYALQIALADALRPRFGDRLIVHTPDTRKQAIDEHYDSDKPTVLLGVAMSEGLDLKQERARFLIIPKVLYPYLGDPYIKQRCTRDRRWYDRQTTLAIVQGAGRVVRSDDDFADIYIFDECFGGFLKKNEPLFPAWFLDAIEVRGKKRPHSVRPSYAAEESGS
jgi:Rad3-related DNA helicase